MAMAYDPQHREARVGPTCALGVWNQATREPTNIMRGWPRSCRTNVLGQDEPPLSGATVPGGSPEDIIRLSELCWRRSMPNDKPWFFELSEEIKIQALKSGDAHRSAGKGT